MKMQVLTPGIWLKVVFPGHFLPDNTDSVMGLICAVVIKLCNITACSRPHREEVCWKLA